MAGQAAGGENGREPDPGDLRWWARRNPDKAAVIIGDSVTSFAALEASANRLARLFASRGLARGDHVAAILPNSTFMFVIAWAAWRSGVYFTPVASSLSARDAAAILADCRARLLIVDGSLAQLAAGLDPLVARVVARYGIGPALPGFAPLEAELSALSPEPRSDEPPGALMLYTSGTTGAPKGVWRPLADPAYRGVPLFVGTLPAVFGFDDRTRYLSPAPLYHAAPLRFSLAVLSAGGTVFAMPRFDASEALGLLARSGITHSQWVPTMMQRMLALPEGERCAFAAPAHRVAIHAAAPCPVPVKRAMIDWWGPILLEYYAGSESVGMTIIDSAQWLRRPGSVGRACAGEIHIVDDEFRDLPARQTGRVYFSGSTKFEYFNAPEKTATRTSPAGWQTLGDIGWVDEEGYLFLTDRQDDMIISGGVNLYPQEIEAALLEAPEVADCGVVGMPHPDFGECAVAFVVLKSPGKAASPGRADPRDTLALLDAFCRQRLGRIRRPARIVLVDEVPRSPTGKLLRRELRKIAVE